MSEENKELENVTAGEENSVAVSQEVTESVAEKAANLAEGFSGNGANSNSGQKPKKEKKHKGLKIALIVILAIVVLCGAFFAYVYSTQKEYVQNKWAMMTKDDIEYFRFVMDRNIGKFETKYQDGFEKSKNVTVPEDWTTKGSLKVTLDASLGQLFLGKSFAGIKDVGANYEASADKDGNLSFDLVPFYKNVDLLEASGLVNISNRKLYASIPSYRSEAVDLTAILDQYSEKLDELEKALGDNVDPEKLKKQIGTLKNSFDKEKIDELIRVIYDKVDEAELAKEVSVSVNGVDKEVNVLSCRLSKQQCIEIVKEYVDRLEVDFLTLIPDLSGLDLSGIMGGDAAKFSDLLKIKEKIADLKKDLYNKMEVANLSADLSFYVDAKGDILGGSIKVAYNETKVKLDCLRLVDENDENKAQFVMDVTLNGMKLASVTGNTEKSEGKCTFDFMVKPGSMIEAVLKGGSSYVLTIKGNATDMSQGSCDVDIAVVLNGNSGEIASIYLKNSFSGGSKSLIDTSEGNVIDIMELAETDYIDLGALLKPIVGKLDEINDENLNNFISGVMKNNLGLDMDVDGLKTMIDTGLISAGNSIAKDRLRKFLGIEPPYDYTAHSEKAKEEPEGTYVYSWDILKEGPANVVTDNLTFKVYDYFDRPDEYTPDIEGEKIKFLEEHMSESFERPAEDGEAIEMGDKILFDVVPVIGSMVVDSYAYTDLRTTLGDYEYGAGIDDKLVGITKGQTIDLELTLDDRFGAFAGYTGTFRITIKDITKVKMPEWNEEFIVGQLGYESVEALEQELLEKAKAEFDAQAEQYKPADEEIKAKLLDVILEKVDVECCGSEAAELLRAYSQGFKGSYGNANYQQMYKALGYSPETISKLIGTDTRIADYGMRRRIVDAIVAYQYGVTLTQAEYESYINNMATDLGYVADAAFIETVEGKFGKRQLVDAIIDLKVQELIYSSANIDWE